MLAHEFDTQMNRLRSTFGVQAYGDERTKLIWGAVRDLSAHNFEAVVDQLIGCCARPPLLPEIRSAMAALRERGWAREKQQHAQESIQAFRVLSREEAQEICGAVRAVLNGRLSGSAAESHIGRILNDRRPDA